jgi:phosphoribosylamine-glycine ligase
MNILVLAGGADQAALIARLKRRGHAVALVDYLENPPAKVFADKHIAASTLDVEAVCAIAEREKAGLVLTACTDQALLTQALVSERLGLPCYISAETALNVTNKLYMKNVFAQINVPTARYLTTKSVDCAAPGLSFPVVVKPVDCNSSKGVMKARDGDEVRGALREALSLSRTREAIIEEYIEGTEISADFYVARGRAVLLSATSSMKMKHKSYFTITGSYYPAVSAREEEAIARIGQNIARGFRLTDSPMLVQLIKNQRGMFVLEFSARMGGGSKYRLIEELSGVDIMDVYIDLALGEKPEAVPEKKTKHALMRYIYCVPGVIDSFVGFEELKRTNIIRDYFLYKTKGMEIAAAKTSGDRAAGFLIAANTRENLLAKLSVACNGIKVCDARGNNLILQLPSPPLCHSG